MLFEFIIELVSSYYLIVGEEAMGKTSWMISDEVSSLASKRMMCLVCRSGQSNSSALMILCSSMLGFDSLQTQRVTFCTIFQYPYLAMNTKSFLKAPFAPIY